MATSFGKGLQVFLTVVRQGPIRADALGELLELPVSSVYRYLRELREAGMVDEEAGRYTVGAALSATLGGGPGHARLAELGRPLLARLRDATRETAVLAVRSGLSALCLEQEESRHTVRIAFRRGELLPLYAGAGQRALLAFAAPEVVDAVVRRGLAPRTRATPSEEVLREGLAEIRRRGVAVSRGEFIPGTVAVAVPVRDPAPAAERDGRDGVLCSLCVAAGAERWTERWQREAVRELRAAARILRDGLVEPV